MIISASRRTDIPAYFSEWFKNRIKDKFCLVPNPFNINQISLVDLSEEEVDVIVFWTRNPQPLIKYLNFLDGKGYKYYFQFTINNYPKIYEKFNPPVEKVLKTFINLSKRIGNGKVIWRYDPIIFSDDLTHEFHLKNFEFIANKIGNYTERVVVSIVDDYFKTSRRLIKLGTHYENDLENKPFLEDFLCSIVNIASQFGLEVQSCAEAKDFNYLGIKHGKCIDDDLIKKEFGIDLKYKKDKSQRIACGCTVSKDIGVNDTCLMGCEYCYATKSHKVAIKNKKKHDPNFPSIFECKITDELEKRIEDLKLNKKIVEEQLSLSFQ